MMRQRHPDTNARSDFSRRTSCAVFARFCEIFNRLANSFGVRFFSTAATCLVLASSQSGKVQSPHRRWSQDERSNVLAGEIIINIFLAIDHAIAVRDLMTCVLCSRPFFVLVVGKITPPVIRSLVHGEHFASVLRAVCRVIRILAAYSTCTGVPFLRTHIYWLLSYRYQYRTLMRRTLGVSEISNRAAPQFFQWNSTLRNTCLVLKGTA